MEQGGAHRPSISEGEELPPVELYKLEEAYFVVDGHHRVSVARYHDVPTLEAAVAEFHPNRLLGRHLRRRRAG